MQVRLDEICTKKIKESALANRRSGTQEANIAIASYYLALSLAQSAKAKKKP